jgi:hypothetical protein
MHPIHPGHSRLWIASVALWTVLGASNADAQQKQHHPVKTSNQPKHVLPQHVLPRHAPIFDAPTIAAESAPRAAKQVHLQIQAIFLVQPFILLSAIDFDYGDHRTNAGNHVKSAIHSFMPGFVDNNPGIYVRVNAVKSFYRKVPEYWNWSGRLLYDPDAYSDYLMFQVASQLMAARAVAANYHQGGAVKSIDAALGEIDMALRAEAPKRIQRALRGKEAHALKEAFVLLSAAKEAYEGHRENAVRNLASVIASLDNQVAESLAQEITNAQIAACRKNTDALATAMAKADKAKNAKAYRRYVSDMLVYEALGITSFVGELLGLNDQHAAYDSMASAMNEMELALFTL